MRYFCLIALSLAFWACSTSRQIPKNWRFDLSTKPVTATHGMVATDAPLATKAGVEILKQGGNAIDATVATAFALTVVYPNAGNIGGGGFIVAHFKNGEAIALDFREKAPLAATRDMFLNKNGETTNLSLLGYKACGVPGSVAGLYSVHQKYGKLTWKEIMAPAIKLAREGFVVDKDFAHATASKAEEFALFDGTRKLMMPTGKTPQKGSIWKNPDLAATLQRIADKGPDGFYRGKTADLIVAEMQRGDGLITHEDLEQYQPKWHSPIRINYRGHEISSMPPVSSGGVTLSIIFNILERYNLKEMGWHSRPEIHYFTEAMRRAFAVRNALLGDPAFVDMDLPHLTSMAFATELASTIKDDQATPSKDIDFEKGIAKEGNHTTHFSVIDGEGNAVAMTTTLNTGFGCKIVVDGAGFFLNNEMDDFTSKPGSPNVFGLVQGEANAIVPGKRMLSSMTPTIVLDKKDKPMLITGASGGPTIITATAQIISNVIDFNMNISRAVLAPRIHHQHYPDVLLLEKGGFFEKQKLEQERYGQETKINYIGNVAASILIKDGVYYGQYDPRVDGLAEGY